MTRAVVSAGAAGAASSTAVVTVVSEESLAVAVDGAGAFSVYLIDCICT